MKPFEWKRCLAFLAAGIPGFGLALALNWFLVKRADWPLPGAYALTLLIQVSVNFLFCRYLVFERREHVKLVPSYFKFITGILGFRLLDWGAYSLLTAHTAIPFLLAQVLVMLVFVFLKFEYSRSIFHSEPS